MLIRLIVLFLFIQTAIAETFEVKYGLFKYNVEFNEESLLINGNNLRQSLKKNDCNKMLFEKLTGDLRKDLRTMTLFKKADSEKVEIHYQEEKSYHPRTSPTGKRFLALPKDIQKLILTEKLKCGKS